MLGTSDRIVDFKQSDSDRYQFQPAMITGLFNAGTMTGTNLNDAIIAAYADKDQVSANQTLAINEAVFFQYNSRSYLSINNKTIGFQSGNDSLIEVTGINYKTGDNSLGTLVVGDYFLT